MIDVTTQLDGCPPITSDRLAFLESPLVRGSIEDVAVLLSVEVESFCWITPARKVWVDRTDKSDVDVHVRDDEATAHRLLRVLDVPVDRLDAFLKAEGV